MTDVKASRQEQQQHQWAAVRSGCTAPPCIKQHQITALRPTHHLFHQFYSAAKKITRENNDTWQHVKDFKWKILIKGVFTHMLEDREVKEKKNMES